MRQHQNALEPDAALAFVERLRQLGVVEVQPGGNWKDRGREWPEIELDLKPIRVRGPGGPLTADHVHQAAVYVPGRSPSGCPTTACIHASQRAPTPGG
jgi:hypothetical protein